MDMDIALDCCRGPSTTRRLWTGGIIFVLLLTGILLAVSIKRVDNTELAAEYDIFAKKLDDAARDGGLYLGPPGFRFIKFPSIQITEELTDVCLSVDGLRVGFSVKFQFKIIEEWLVPAVLKYRNFETWSKVVKSAGESAIHHSCSEFKISSFQNQRGIIQDRMKENLSIKLEGQNKTGVDGVYARAISLQLLFFDLPSRYTEAVTEKQSAIEDIGLAKNQRIQEVTKAETQRKAAEEQAVKILETAANDANVTLTQANLKAEEILDAFEKESRTIVSVKESLNFTTEGILGYTANQFISRVPTLKVTAGEPAKFSQKDEL